MWYLSKIRRYHVVSPLQRAPRPIEGAQGRSKGRRVVRRRMEQGAEQPDQLASPGGKLYTLKKGKGQYGYEGVTAPHGPDKGYHARPPKDMTNGKQQFIPGAACKTPEEAALRRAKFVAAPFDIVKQDPDRAPKGEGKQVSGKRPLEAAAQEDPEDMPAWVVSRDAFTMWQAGFEPPASVRLSAAAEAEVWRLRAWATAARAKAEAPFAAVAATATPKQKVVPVTASAARTPAASATSGSVMQKRVQSVLEQQAGPSPQFDPDVLARVAAIKTGAIGDGRA